MGKYLVTGAAGFIGRSIAAALLKRGETVRGMDNFITGKRANLAGLEAMEFIEGDLADPAACARACAGVEIVFHEAALASVPRSVANPVATNVACVDATLNLLVAARDAGVRRVVYAGSSSAYGESATLPKHERCCRIRFRRTRWPSWRASTTCGCLRRCMDWRRWCCGTSMCLGRIRTRPSHYSGVLAIFCRKMLAGEQPTIYGDGEQSRDFTYIENVVHANLLAAAAPAEKVAGQMMNAATGKRDYAE